MTATDDQFLARTHIPNPRAFTLSRAGHTHFHIQPLLIPKPLSYLSNRLAAATPCPRDGATNRPKVYVDGWAAPIRTDHSTPENPVGRGGVAGLPPLVLVQESGMAGRAKMSPPKTSEVSL